MNRSEKIIREAFYALERAADSQMETSRLLRECLYAAREGECRHRKGAPFGVRRTSHLSVECAAMFFAVKWACEVHRKKVTLPEAAALRLDALYGEALGDLLRAEKRWPFKKRPEAADLDYSDVFWGSE